MRTVSEFMMRYDTIVSMMKRQRKAKRVARHASTYRGSRRNMAKIVRKRQKHADRQG